MSKRVSSTVHREVARTLRRLGLANRSLLVAVSGGIDSVSLARILCELASELNLVLSIGHVNHGLRGIESQADEGAVRELAKELRVPVRTRRVDPGSLRAGRPSRDRPTLQEAARELRYGALRSIAEELHCDAIATAHTADDQAETVLLRLLRGTGPDGLAGIPEVSHGGRVVRPLLRVERAQIQHQAREAGWSWREDSSNASDVYARNRLRRHWLPGLAGEFNPRLLRAIAGLAEAQQKDAEWVAALVEREFSSRFSEEGGWLHIDGKDWGSLPESLSSRLARRALQHCGSGRHVSRVHLDRMSDYLRSGCRGTFIELPGGLRLEKTRDPGSGFRLGPLRDAAAG